MREVENAVQESHDYVSCQEQTSKCKDYWKSKEMSTKNIVTTSHLRISKQQRCCLRKHLNKLSKTMSHSRKHSDELLKWWKCQNQEYWVTTKEVIQESTQIGYQNNKLFKKALRWAIETTKMSKSRISSNNKRGHLRKHSDRLLKWQKTLSKDDNSEVNECLTNVLRYEDRMLSS